MKINFATKKLEKYFTNYAELQRKVDPSWVRTIIKQITALKAAEKFEDFLALKLWHPEQLKGADHDCWSIHVAPHARMILRPNADGKSVMICTEIEVKGVCDYHGDKSNWYIP